MTALAISNLVLWAVVVALIMVVLALARQIGVLHQRIAPVGALMLTGGLQVGEPAPEVDVVAIDGRSRRIAGVRPDGKSTLLLFVSPSCPVCKSLLPAVKSSAHAERAWLDAILASDGDTGEQQQFVDHYGLRELTYVISAPLGMAYRVNRLPYAALIDEQGILRARGLVNSREHLESLFEAKRLGVSSLQEYFASRAQAA